VKLSAAMGAVEQQTLHLDLNVFGGSALTDDSIAVPDAQKEAAQGILSCQWH